METLASVWSCDPRDISDLGQPPSMWGSQCVPSAPPAGLMWTEQLSPHLQRNKQLQDTLQQREEQLLRLQEENNKLREFLNSSFVRNLEQKAKKLTADGRRNLKRNLMDVDGGPFQTSSPLQTSQQASKRVCRNLTAEFCSKSPSSEPNLDLWVLRMLGLKDQDTIDTSNDDSSSPPYGLSGLVYNVASSSSSESTLSSSFRPSVTASTPPSVHSCHQTSTQQTGCRFSTADCREADCGSPARSPQNCRTPPGPHFDFTAAGLPSQFEASGNRSYSSLTAFQSPPPTGELAFTPSPDSAEISSTTATSRIQTPVYWSPLRGSREPPQDNVQFSPPGERVPFSPILSSSPVTTQLWTPVCGGDPTSPSAGSRPPATPQTPRSRSDLAFSMSLSPSSSVKTHSFPQGQAFVRKDPEGRWNFTWVPRQGP